MKKLLPLALLITCIVSCSPKVYPVQSCNLVADQNNTITLRSSGFGKQKVESLDAAERYALETILFRGVPGSQYSSPLVGINEEQVRQANPRYFKEFFENGRHKSFIVSSVPVSDYSWTKYKAWTISVDITINVVSLRKDLEQHGVIRRFGL